MTDRYAPPPRLRSLRAVIIVMLIAFVAGLAVMGWALTQWLPAPKADAASAPQAETTNAAAPALADTGKGAPAAPALNAPATTVAPAPSSAAPQLSSLTDARVAVLEARLAEIDRHAAASADEASRAEGLLIAFAARRAIDSGVALGYLEGELNSHFGSAQPRAVANIIAASRSPVTLEGLRVDLDRVALESDPHSSKADWWTHLMTNLGTMITVRKAGDTATTPDERLSRARLALNTGAVQNALAEIARLPGGPATNAWVMNARRYIEAHSALDLLEAAALMRPKPTPAPPVLKPSAPAPALPTGTEAHSSI